MESKTAVTPAPYQELYDWMQTVTLTFIGVIFLLLFAAGRMSVDGPSMTPTFLDGDQIILQRMLYTPDYGDTIVFSTQKYKDGAALVKRVIALEGDVVNVDVSTGQVSVNGQVLDEPYINEITARVGDTEFPFTVPEGHIFVMGDNRNNSLDSRWTDIGAVDTREVVGKVIAVFWPAGRMKLVR